MIMPYILYLITITSAGFEFTPIAEFESESTCRAEMTKLKTKSENKYTCITKNLGDKNGN